jgi:hypothetical protein
MPCNFLRNLRGKAASSIEAENLTEVTVPFTYTAKKSPALYTGKGPGFSFFNFVTYKKWQTLPKNNKISQIYSRKTIQKFLNIFGRRSNKICLKNHCNDLMGC